MELELGLKITRTREDVSSSVDFRFSKDPFGPLVLSRETDWRFIIIIHLKGFKKEGIEIEINEEGNRITIRGRKPVEEMVLIRWMAWRKEVEFRVFSKVFRIPDFVDLDRIKAKFDDDDATLTITMPKRVKGISGFKIEEDEEESAELGDVSEADHKEEKIDKREIEQNREREESDEHSAKSETEIQEHNERDNQVLEEEQKGFIGGLEEEERDVSEDEYKEEGIDKGEVEEQSREREESDEHSGKSETEIQNQEELGEIIQQKERESEDLVEEQKGLSGGLDEEERDVSEAEHREEEIDKGEVEEQSRERGESDEHSGKSEAEIQKQEEFGEITQYKERESQVLGAEQNGFSGGLDEEEELEDGNLKKIQQIDEHHHILACVEEDEEGKKSLQELTISNKESEESNLRKLPGVEGRDPHERTRHEEQELVKEQEAETKSDDFGSRSFEKFEEREPDVSDRTSKSKAMEKEITDDGLSKVQGINDPKRRNEESKNQKFVEEATSDDEKKQFDRDAKEEVDGKMGEVFTPYSERTQVLGKDDIAETETKVEEFESDKLEADEVDKIHELVEKKEDGKVRRQSEDISLIKLQDTEEQHSKGQRQHRRQEKIKDVVKEKTPEANTNIEIDIPKPVQEIEGPGDERKEWKTKKKAEPGDSKVQVDAKIGEKFAPNIAETKTKAEEFEYDKQKADKVDKIQKLIEKKHEEKDNAKVGTQIEDICLTKPQETEEQQVQGQKQQKIQDEVKGLVEEQSPEAEENVGNDILNPFQEGREEKRWNQDIFQEETKNQPEEYKEKIMSTEEKVNDAGARRVQEIIRQQEFDEPSRCEKESTTQELVKSKTDGEEKKEKEIAETVTKEQESYRPKTLREKEKFQELADEHSAKSETEIQKGKERDSQIFGEKQRGLSGGLDEEDRNDDKLKMIQQIDEQDQILDCVHEEDEEEKKSLQELNDSNKESEESNLRKLPDVEGHYPHEQTRDEEQELEKEQEAETKSDDFGSRAFEETEEQEPDVSDRKSKTRGMEKDMTDDDGLRKVQGIEEPERHNEKRKIQEIVEGQKSDQEKKQFVKMETRDRDAKEEVGKTGEGSQVLEKDDIGETDKNVEEFKSDKLEADEVEETHELVEKKEDKGENSKVRRQSEDRSSLKLQESEEQLSKRQELDKSNKKIKQVMEEKTLEANTNIGSDILKPVQKIEVPEVDTLGETGNEGKEGKEKRKVVTEDAKVQVDVKMGEGFAPNIAETETKAEQLEYDKQKADKVDKSQKLVKEKVEEKDEQVPEAEANIGNDIVNPFQEKRKSQEISQEETKNQPEEYKEKIMATEENINDTAARKVQETTRQQEMDEPAGCEKESNTQEMVKSKANDGKMGEGFTPHTEVTEVLGKDDITKTETKVEEFESDKLEADEVDKMNELVEKKDDEGENGNVGRRSEDRSLIKLQESEEQQSMGQKHHRRNEKIKQVVKEKLPEANTNIGNDIPKPVQEIEVPGDERKEGNEKKKAEPGDSKVQVDAKMGEKFAPNIAETETKAEEFEYDKQKADEVDKSQKLIEEKVEETQSEDISLTKLQEIEEQQIEGQKRHEKQDKIKGLVEEQVPEAESKNQPEEYNEKTREKINDAGARKVQEIIRQQMLDELARGEKESKTRELVKSKTNDEEKKEKEIAETETKEQESYRRKTLREQENVEELAEEKSNFSKEEEEFAKEKTEFCDNDDIPRNIPDIEQRGSDTMKGKEENLLEEKVCDSGKGIIAVVETKADNDKSKKIEESEEQQSLEEYTCTEKVQKLIGGETSGHEEVEDVVKEKKTTEEEKGVHRKRDLDAAGKHIEGTIVQEKITGIYRNEHGEEKKNEADRPEKIPGTIEQEFVNLNNQLEQNNIGDGEKTEELVGEITKDCNKEVGSEESKTKTIDDDVVRKVSGIKEQELYEPKRENVSKIKGLIEKKTGDHDDQEEKEIVESEIEAEYGSLRKVKGIEEQELHEPEIHKERDKNQIEEPILQKEEKTVPSFQEEKEVPSGEEEENIVKPMKITESENSVDVQEIKKERPEKPEKHEKPCNIPGVVEAGQKGRKEEEQEEKEMDRAELENEKESSKSVKEIEQHEYDEFKRSTIEDKMQEIEEKDKTRTMEENENVERKKPKDLRKVRDDEDLELGKPYKRQKDNKVQELVEMETGDYREKVKKQDENDILIIPETRIPNLDEFERHDEQSNIPKLVEEEEVGSISELGKKIEDDSSDKYFELEEEKPYEKWTHEEQENRKDLVKEEATDPKYKHSGGEDNEEEQEEEMIITKAESKTEEDSSTKVHKIDQQENDKRSMVQDKMQETEEKDKTRQVEENEIVERMTVSKDGSLEKVPESEHSELGRHERHGEEDGIQELVEMGISDHREKEKNKDGDDILRCKETGELERHCKQRKSHQTTEDEKGEGKMENISEQGGIVEGDSSGKFQEFQKPKSYEDWRQEENEETKKLVKDKHRGGAGGEDEEERYEKVAQTEMTKAVEDEMNEKVGENKEPESDKEERCEKQDKLTGVQREGESDRGKEISQELKVQEKTDIVSDYVEDVTGVQDDEKAEEAADEVAKSENRSSREVQTTNEDELEESEEDKEYDKISETNDTEVREEDEESVAEEEIQEQVPKLRNVRETKELEADVHENEGKTENCREDDRKELRVEKGKQEKTVETVSRKRFKTQSDDGIQRKIQDTKMEASSEKIGTNEEVERKKLVTKDESLRKGQDFLEKKLNMSKRRPVEQEKIREPEEFEIRDQVYKDEEKAEDERKIDNGQSNKSKMLKLDEPEKQQKIQKPMEEKSNASEIEKEGNKEPAEEKIRDKIDSRVKDQEAYELLKNEEHDKIPECHRKEEKTMEQRGIEEMMRTVEDVSSRQVQQIKPHESDGVEKHRKLSEKQRGVEEIYEGGGNKEKLQTKPVASSESRDTEEKGSDQTKMFAEQGKVQELMPEEGENEEREQKEKKMSVLQVESKANDDSLEKNETEGHELSGLRGEKKNRNHQELVEMKKSDQRKEEKEEEIDGQAETIVEHDSSRKIHRHGERKSDKMKGKLAEEETSDDKEGTRAGKVLGEIGMTGDVSETEEQEQDKMRSFVEKDTSDQAKNNKSQETNNRDDSSIKTQENEKQESHEQKRNEEQDKKNLILLGKETEDCRNEEEDDEIKEVAEAEKLKGNEKRESIKMVERHENQDDIKQLLEEKLKKQDGEDQKSMEVLEVDGSMGPERLRRKENSREQSVRDNHKDEETARIEPKSKHIESGNIQQIKEEEKSEQVRVKEQGRIKEIVKDKSHYSREKENRGTEFEDCSSKRIQDKDEKESIEPGRAEKRDKIQETSVDDEEELEIEFEEEEEDWEAEIIQETDSDEDNDKIRKINRIRFGFRLVGGSTLFMSFIVIVIHFIHSKKKNRYYKF